MSTAQLLATGLYAGLAIFALLGTWKRPRRRILGIALLICWALSNAIFWAVPVGYHPTMLPFLDVFFALMAAKVGLETGSRVPLVLIALSVLAMAANAAFSITGGHTLGQIVTYEVALNVIFAAQCIITGAWGLKDELGRIARISRGARDSGGTLEPSRHSAGDEIG